MTHSSSSMPVEHIFMSIWQAYSLYVSAAYKFDFLPDAPFYQRAWNLIADHLGDFRSVTKERFHQKVAALNKLLQETRNHAIRQVQSLESSNHKNRTTSDKMTKRISLLVRGW